MLSLLTFPACHMSGSSLLSIIHPSTPTKGKAGEAALWHREKWKILTAILSCANPVLNRVSLDLVVSFLLLFLANEKLATASVLVRDLLFTQVLSPFAVFMASNIYIYTHTQRLCGFIYPFLLKKTYKKYCLYNLQTPAIKLFCHFGASPEICGFSCC